MKRSLMLNLPLLVVMALGLASAPAFAASTFTFVDDILITDLSEDGSVAAGGAIDGYYSPSRWTAAGGVVVLPRSSGILLGRPGGIPGISADGERIGACVASEDTTIRTQGRWTNGFGWEQTMPPLLPNGAITDQAAGSAYDISGDGETVVGLYWATGGRAYASSWTQAGGMVNLGSQDVTRDSRANAVNHDGSVIVGWSANPDSSLWMPTVWEDGTLTVLTYTGGWCEAKAVNPAGDTIVGSTFNSATRVVTAGMWVRAETTWTELDLGYLPGTFPDGAGEAVAWDLSADGSIVVGTNRYDGWTSDGFVWTPEQGMMLAQDFMTGMGVAVPDSFRLIEMSSVSEDGKVMAGICYNRFIFPRERRSFIVTLDDASPVQDVPVSKVMDLSQPYPNPFNPSTSFDLSIKQDSMIRLDICDARGRLVRVLHNGMMARGQHVVQWNGMMDDGHSAPSGLYLARIRDDAGNSQTRRMMLVK